MIAAGLIYIELSYCSYLTTNLESSFTRGNMKASFPIALT